MNRDTESLERRIEDFSFDPPGGARDFVSRLARENRWSLRYARAVVDEYRRFLILAVTAGHPVTPSEQVDQAWHLHLTDSESYWNELCPKVLGRPLHHRPSRGGARERKRYREDYRRTLESYASRFGAPPPKAIWSEPERRFGVDLRSARVNTVENWVLKKPAFIARLGDGAARSSFANRVVVTALGAAVSLGCAEVGASFPFSLTGPEFLVFYAVSAALAAAVAALLQERPRVVELGRELTAYEAAYLSGGPARVAEAAVAQMVVSGVVALDSPSGVLRARRPPSDADSFEQKFYRYLAPSPRSVREVSEVAEEFTDDLARDLAGFGLWSDRRSWLPLLVALGVPLLGAVKIGVGVYRERPVGFLIVLTAIATIAAVSWFRPRRGPTARARRLLRVLRGRHANWRDRAEPRSPDAPPIAPLAVGLFGLAVLVDLGLPDVAAAFSAIPSRDRGGWMDSSTVDTSGSSGSGCSSDGGGGGCGGCGGGGGD